MKKQLEDFQSLMKRYGYVVYNTYDEAVSAEADLLPNELPTFAGGTRRCDILFCLRHLFHREPVALAMMEDVYKEMKETGELLHPHHME